MTTPEPVRIAQMWAAMDPAKPETLVAVIEHVRCSVAEGLCPICTGPVVRKAGLQTQNEVAFYCTTCPCRVPLIMAEDWSREIEANSLRARRIATLLQKIWEKIHAESR